MNETAGWSIHKDGQQILASKFHQESLDMYDETGPLTNLAP